LSFRSGRRAKHRTHCVELRDDALIEEVPCIQGAVPQKIVDVTVELVCAEAVTMLTWAPGRFPYSAP